MINPEKPRVPRVKPLSSLQVKAGAGREGGSHSLWSDCHCSLVCALCRLPALEAPHAVLQPRWALYLPYHPALRGPADGGSQALQGNMGVESGPIGCWSPHVLGLCLAQLCPSQHRRPSDYGVARGLWRGRECPTGTPLWQECNPSAGQEEALGLWEMLPKALP